MRDQLLLSWRREGKRGRGREGGEGKGEGEREKEVWEMRQIRKKQQQKLKNETI